MKRIEYKIYVMERTCQKCKKRKPLKGGYTKPNKFICKECKSAGRGHGDVKESQDSGHGETGAAVSS